MVRPTPNNICARKGPTDETKGCDGSETASEPQSGATNRKIIFSPPVKERYSVSLRRKLRRQSGKNAERPFSHSLALLTRSYCLRDNGKECYGSHKYGVIPAGVRDTEAVAGSMTRQLRQACALLLSHFNFLFFLLTHFPFIQLRQKFFLRDKRFPVPRRVATPSLSCALDSH